MSSYVNFYLRINDNFAPIGDFSRNSKVYETYYGCGFSSYERILPLHEEHLRILKDYVIRKIKTEKETKERYEKRISLIMNAENTPLNEKLEEIDYIEEAIGEISQDIEEYEYARNYFDFLEDMIVNYHFSDKSFENDYFHYIYAGIEANGDLESVGEGYV